MLVRKMLLSRHLRSGTIWKGTGARLIHCLGLTLAIVVMPTKSAVLVVLVLSVAKTNADASAA